VNGTVAQMPKASIVIDGGRPVIFIPDQQSAAVTTNNLMFKSNDLSEGSHTLVVTSENNNALWIDYLLVIPNTPPASNPVLPAPTSSLPFTSTVSESSSSPSPTASPSSKKSPSAGVIAGAVVGPLFFAALVVTAFFIFCRQRRRLQEVASGTAYISALSMS
jgi:hypothetical protein